MNVKTSEKYSNPATITHDDILKIIFTSIFSIRKFSEFESESHVSMSYTHIYMIIHMNKIWLQVLNICSCTRNVISNYAFV